MRELLVWLALLAAASAVGSADESTVGSEDGSAVGSAGGSAVSSAVGTAIGSEDGSAGGYEGGLWFLCPPGCKCSDILDYTMMCPLLVLSGMREQYVNIDCGGGSFTCAELPAVPFGGAGSRVELGLKECAVPESLRCAATRLGDFALTKLTLAEVPAPRAPLLAPEQVRGLHNLTVLAITWIDCGGGERLPIPTAALAELPALRKLTVRGAPLLVQRDAFRDAPPLDYLELSCADLTRLPPGALSPLPSLRNLSLFKNSLTHIDVDTFQGLESLEQLTLDSNPLRALHASALSHTPRLRALSLFDVQLERLDAHLANLTHLDQLLLSHNRANLTLSPGALAGLPALTTLQLNAAGLRHLPENLLTGSTALRTITLATNQLASLPPGLFHDQHNLVKLDLSGNQLASLPDQLFLRLRSLTELDLKRNLLVELMPRMLDGVPALISLSVSHNRLRSVHEAALRGAGRHLEKLDLSYNELDLDSDDQEEERSPFNPLDSLTMLDLSRNRLRSVPVDVSRVHTSLETLDLSYNRITQLSNYDWGAAVTVDLRHNNISSVHLPRAYGPRIDSALSSILLDDNPFDCDCRLYAFAQRLRGRIWSKMKQESNFVIGDARCAYPKSLLGRKVRNVNLNEFACQMPSNSCGHAGCQCTVRSITPALELSCPSLPDSLEPPTRFGVELVDLRLNSLNSVPSSLLWLPPFVRKLDISGIGLKEIPFESAPESLQILDLSSNNLTEMSIQLLQLPTNLTFLLDGNPFVCDCWHKHHISALLKHHTRITNFLNLTCSDGNLLWKVNDSQLCNTLHAAILGGLLAFVGLLVAVTAVVLYRYSFEVKVFLYSRGWCRRWVHEEDLDRDKKFDAFLSFSHEDEEFVVKNLLPGLEAGPHPFKICIHYRDWIAGEWIPAQIARSVDQSRRTVVVLSNNFLNSIWGRLEFRAAHMSAVQEHRSRVIVLLLDDVTTNKELDAELRAYLSTNTYLKWGDPWFWERLRYALPHRREERDMRKAGSETRKLIAGKEAGGLHTQLTPNGKIVNAAAIQNAPKLDAGVIATFKV